MRLAVSLLAATILLVLIAGCAGSGDDTQPHREDPFMVRSFEPVSGDRWIGNAVCYGPHRDGQRPGGPTPTADEIREDLQIMLRHWNLLRLYGSEEFGRTVLEVIRDHDLDMKVMMGAWVATEETRDDRGQVTSRDEEAAAANLREADHAIALANEFPDIVIAVCVGNETQVSWSPFPNPVEVPIRYIRRVRAAVSQPVTTADDYMYWITPESRVLAAEIDFVTTHAHPLWNGRQLDEGMAWLQEQVAAITAMHPDRLLVIGETGWATSALDEGEQGRLIKGAAGDDEQAVFHAAMRRWADEQRMCTFVFEAFDENWKGGDHPAEVEKHWGLYRADRTPKPAAAAMTP